MKASLFTVMCIIILTTLLIILMKTSKREIKPREDECIRYSTFRGHADSMVTVVQYDNRTIGELGDMHHLMTLNKERAHATNNSYILYNPQGPSNIPVYWQKVFKINETFDKTTSPILLYVDSDAVIHDPKFLSTLDQMMGQHSFMMCSDPPFGNLRSMPAFGQLETIK